MRFTNLSLIISLLLSWTHLSAGYMDGKLFHCGGISDEVISAMYIGEESVSFQARAMGEYFFLNNDVISPYTIIRLNKRIEQIEKVGGYLQIDFNKSDCIYETNNEQLDWRCYKRNPGTLGKGLNYKSAAFYLYSKSVQSPYSTRTEYIVGVALETELPGETLVETTYYQESSSSSESCRFSLKQQL
jgi:hypothetical protein